jgi:hypothetical protein
MVNNNLHDQLLDPKYTVSAPVKQRFEHSFSLFLTVPCYSTISPSKHLFFKQKRGQFAWPAFDPQNRSVEDNMLKLPIATQFQTTVQLSRFSSGLSSF